MLHFCTLFDSNYLTRGLSLHASLLETHENFHLYIFAFDDIARNVLTELKLKHATVVALSEFEDADLLKIKPTRSQMEYCWTCTPSVIRYCLNEWNMDICTYLDADIYFFSNSQTIFDELDEYKNDVLITEHRFSDRYKEYEENGSSDLPKFLDLLQFEGNAMGFRILTKYNGEGLDLT